MVVAAVLAQPLRPRRPPRPDERYLARLAGLGIDLMMPHTPAPSLPEAHHSYEGGEVESGADPALMSERERLVWAMDQCGWVQAKAARLLNMTPRQIGYALQKYHIEVKRL